MEQLIVGYNHHQIQQEMNDIQLARNAEVDIQEQLALAQQQQTSQQINQQLLANTRNHPIATVAGSPASSSFDLSRELADTSPPNTPGSSPVPIGDTPNVSPIPIQNISPKSPPLNVSSPPRPRTRATSRPGSSTETGLPETGVPTGKQVEAKRRGRPPGSKNT